MNSSNQSVACVTSLRKTDDILAVGVKHVGEDKIQSVNNSIIYREYRLPTQTNKTRWNNDVFMLAQRRHT